MAAAAGAGAGPQPRNATDIAREINLMRQQNQDTLVQLQQQQNEEKRERHVRIQQLEQQIVEKQNVLRNPNLQGQYRQQSESDLHILLQRKNELGEREQSQHLFKVINNQIKTLILDLKTKAANGSNLNSVVKNTVETLEIMGNNVEAYANLKARNEEVLARDKQVIQNIQTENVRDFINAANKTTDQNGVLSAVGKTINLDTLDTVVNDPNSLATEDDTDPVTIERIQNRLKNCQYLEILYLTKHDELMKIFRFTLNLYDKYTYAIKILLFVLKNLLDQRPCPPREPPQPGERPPGEPHPPIEPGQIRLPKALITNIKQLLKDQKQVKDVIDRMRPIVEHTLPELVKKDVADRVSAGTVGSTIDEQNP